MKQIYCILLFALVLTLGACGLESGSMIIDKSESLNQQSDALKKNEILYFDPEVTFYEIKEDVNQDIITQENISVFLKKVMKKDASKQNFSIRFFADDQSGQYYTLYVNQLMLLKAEIERVAILQDNKLNKYLNSSQIHLSQNVFVYPPRISPEYSGLTTILGTPYIGLCGIFSVKCHPKTAEARAFVRKEPNINLGNYFYYYHIIVNLETSQIEYRELKLVSTVAREQFIDPVIYDSYVILNNNLQ